MNSGALLNAGGRLQSVEYLQLNTHGQRLNNAHSRNAGILSGGNLWLNAGEIDNTSGLMAAAGETRVSNAFTTVMAEMTHESIYHGGDRLGGSR
ncbi:hypothetical protein SGGMMB4_03202 [Sodalis glossinidius str. 'morsitans']|uniref:Uncharacterized protein n=1 Tax=Sodalis glossinidius (strain morsitans) TaxID=343509 RepID=A0A193QK48_SODGM|nr:hypothetical protein [Sodalis glossinidius]CRL45463.1 hypothetical protein SGGMMB4_03202 [Sodalis glossinidius str. 'morsitans']